MVGSLYLAEQYVQRVAGYSALGAASVLLLVRAALSLTGRLVGEHGERLTAISGSLPAGFGLLIWRLMNSCAACGQAATRSARFAG